MPALARLAVRPADRDAIRLDAVPLSEEGRNGGGAVAREIAEASSAAFAGHEARKQELAPGGARLTHEGVRPAGRVAPPAGRGRPSRSRG